MVDYYEVLPGTDEYKMAHNVYHCVDDWRQENVKDDFENVLGLEITNGICTNPNHLICNSVPDSLKAQFKKNRGRYGHYEAKMKSDINKKFLEVVGKHDLKYYDMVHFTFMFNCCGNIKSLYHTKVNGVVRYFVEVQNIDSKPDYFNDRKSLRSVTESEFLTIRATSAKEQEMNNKED